MENKNNKKYDTQLKIAVLVLAIIFTAKDFVPYFPHLSFATPRYK